MQVHYIDNIITKEVLNNAGELETTDFKQIKKTSNIKGGWNMDYKKPRQEVERLSLKSSTDIEVYHWVSNRFTYDNVVANIAYKNCPVDISQAQYSKLVHRLVETNYIMKVEHQGFRLNPFMHLPYRSETAKLQREWNEIVKTQQHAALYKVLEAIEVEANKPKRFSLDEVGKLSGNGMERLMDAGMRATMSDEEKWKIYKELMKE